jgi:SAM-dependent methyltransferase
MSAATDRGIAAPDAALAFHDAECGGYAADLGLWSELAAAYAASAPILDLGAGSGRVALALAGEGHRVLAIEQEPLLAAALASRAAAAGQAASVEVLVADARDLDVSGPRPDPTPALALAPMQFLQLFDEADRARVLAGVAATIAPGGLLAVALLDESVPLSSGEPEPLPDVREVNGWVHSSLPLEVRLTEEAVEVTRLRQVVSPTGELTESHDTIRLHRLDPARLGEEAAACGLRGREVRRVGQTEEHVASVAVLMERADG